MVNSKGLPVTVARAATVLFFAGITVASHAATARIAGHVTSALTGDPIARARVEIVLRTIHPATDGRPSLASLAVAAVPVRSVRSDALGAFETVIALNEPDGIAAIHVLAAGFEDIWLTIVPVAATAPATVEVELRPTKLTDAEFDVLDRRNEAGKGAASSEEVSLAEDLVPSSDATRRTLERQHAQPEDTFTVPDQVWVQNLPLSSRSGCGTSGGLSAYIDLDEFIAGVVTNELGDGFPFEALKSQAVAARSYALEQYNRIGKANCGMAYTSSITSKSHAAAMNTSKVVLTYGGSVIRARFSARCNGDYTLNAEDGLGAIGGGHDCQPGYQGGYTPYERSAACSNHSPCVAGSGETCCAVFVEGRSQSIYGHGVGLCQRGAQRYAGTYADDWQTILHNYYSSVSLANLRDVAVGATVKVSIDGVHIRSTACGTDVPPTLSAGTVGTVTAGPSRPTCSLVAGTSYVTWWKVAFPGRTEGWVAEDYLELQSSASSTCYSFATSVSPSGGGSISANPTGTVPCNFGYYLSSSQITLTASPNPGYQFSSWSASGGSLSSNSSNPTTFTITGNASVTGSFTQPTCYTLTRTHDGQGGDPTASPSNSTGCSSGQYIAGEPLSLTASPASGWSVSSWSGTNNNGSTSTTNSVTMPASNRTVSVTYSANAPTCYTLTRTHSGQGNDPTTAPTNSAGCGTGQYIAGEFISLTASPGSGWSVSSWSGTNNDGSTSTTNSVTMPASNRTASVTYSANAPTCYTLTRTHNGQGSDPTAWPTNSAGCGSGQYIAGEPISLTASPASGWSVSSWSGTSNNSSTSTTNSLTMPASSQTVSVSYSASGSGSDLIVDGGFESASSTGNTAPGWGVTPSPGSGHSLIIKNGPFPHLGTSYASLGGTDYTQYDWLLQTVTIPADATAANLTLWVNVTTQEAPGSIAYDVLWVALYDTSGNPIETLRQLSNQDAPLSSNTLGNYFQVGPFDLSPYKGFTFQVGLVALTDSSLPTNFLIDDVSLQVSTPSDTPPTTSITAPGNGATVSGTVNVAATASDDKGVTSLEIDIDGVARAANTNATSLAYSWNTTQVSNGQHTIISKAGDGGGHLTTSPQVTVTVSNASLGAPGNVVATATSASQVNVTWNGVAGAASYQIFRSGIGLVGTSSTNNFVNAGLATNTAYLYQVRAVDSSSNVGPLSNVDLATTVMFTDDPLVVGSTRVKAVHLAELRTAVNAVRATAGLSPAAFTDSMSPSLLIKAIHITELRSNLDAARAALGLSALSYTNPTLASGSSVKAAHITDLRSGVK